MVDLGPGVAIPLIVLALGLLRLGKGPVGAALADRIRKRPVEHDAELLGEIDQLKTRLAEVEERLDFAERLLARKETNDQLPGGVHR
ncbi:MAG TPA: hypothetical protein VHR41_13840 [Gemmatimonadales bacterium]|jgi:hypothetical protein|nr:hypothetical protein [Gemmatimonadales bacterium]